MAVKGVAWCNRIIDGGLIVFALSLPLSTSGTEVGYYIAFLAWLAKMIIKKNFKLPSTPLDWPIIFFWLISFISIVFSVEPSAGMERLRKIPLFFLPYLMVDSIKDEKKTLMLIQLLLAATALTAILGIFNYINGAQRAYNYALEINSLAGFLLMVLPFAVVLSIYRKSLLLKAINGFMAAVIIGGIILTYSRSTYLGIIGMIVVLGFLIKKARYTFLSVFCLLIILSLFSPEICDRFKSIPGDGQERLYMWQIGWQMFNHHPLTGVGIGCVGIEYPKYMGSQTKWGIRRNLHNNFIQEMAEKGIGGLIAFLWILGSFFWAGADTYKRDLNKIRKGMLLGCTAAYTGFVIDGCFKTNLFVPLILRLWLFIMGLGLVINNLCFAQEISTRKFKRILLVKLREIGDTVLATPAIKAVRRNYPDCFFSVLVPETSSDVLFNNSYLNEVISYNQKKPIMGWLPLIWRLRKRRFELAINLHASRRSALITYFSGARFRVVHNHNGKNHYANIPIQASLVVQKDAIGWDLNTCKAVGIETEDKTVEVFPNSDDYKTVENLLKSQGVDLVNDSLIAISIGAREEIRCWPLERYTGLCEYFHAKEGIKVLLSYGPGEQDKIKQITENMKKPPLVIGNLSLLQLAGLFSKCNLFIGNNSGPMHIAVAMGVPTVTICVPKYIQWWHPYNSSCHPVVSNQLNCKDCEKAFCDEKACLEKISVEEVITAAELLYPALKAAQVDRLKAEG